MMSLNLFLSLFKLSDFMPFWKREKTEEQPQEKSKTEVKTTWYKVIEGVSFEGPCPFEEEVKKRYTTADKKSRLEVMDEVKKDWNFPKEVSYMMSYGNRPPQLLVEAMNTEEAEKIIVTNKGIIEKSYNAKLSDKLKLDKF